MNKVVDLKPSLSNSKETVVKPAKFSESKKTIISRFSRIIARANKIREDNPEAFRLNGV